MLRRNPFSHIPLLLPVLALTIGIICGELKGAFWIAAILAISAGTAALMRHHLVAVFFGAACLGCSESLVLISHGPDYSILNQTVTISGIVTDIKESDTSQSATIIVDKYGADSSSMHPCLKFPLRISVPGFSPSLSDYDRITFRATPHNVEPRRDLPDEIDYADFLLRKHIYMSATVPTDNILGLYPAQGLRAYITGLRSRITTIIYRSNLSTRAKEFVNTALMGNASDLSRDTRQAFSDSGLSHILALSGLHVGIIALVITLALYPLYITGAGKWRALIVITILWLYAAVTGLSPSVTRAVIMMSVFLVGRLLQRRTSSVNSLCFAALVILIADPGALFTIGFQLSFSAVLSILLFTEPLNPIPQRNRIPHNLFAMVTVSASAMLGTALISAYYFHSLPVYFLISNILVSILLPPLLAGSLLLILFSACGWDAIWLCGIIDGLYSCIDFIATWISGLPGATIDHIYFPAYILIPYALSLFLLKLWLNSRRRIYILAISASLLLGIATIFIQPPHQVVKSLYISRDTYRTDLIVHDGSERLLILTTAPNEILSVKEKADFRFHDFMHKRNISSIDIDTTSLKNDNVLVLSGKRIAVLLGKDSLRNKKHSDYALVCRGYRKSITEVVNQYSPDTILLSYDLHPNRLKRYTDECNRLNVPYLSLKERPWSMPLYD